MKSVLIAALLAAAPAEQSPPPCLTEAQIEDLALFALPPLLEAAAVACAPALPADAYLLTGGKALASSVAAESSKRWAGASATLSTMAKDKFPANLSEATARGLVHDLALGGLKSEGAQAHCVRINRVADLLSPLPPRNLAGLVVLAVEIGSAGGGDMMSVSQPAPQSKAKSKSKPQMQIQPQVQIQPQASKPPLICPTART